LRERVALSILAPTCALVMGSAVARAPSQTIPLAARGERPGEHALPIIDPVAKTVVSRVPPSGQKHDIAVSPDGPSVFATHAVRGIDLLNSPRVPGSANAPDSLPAQTLVITDRIPTGARTEPFDGIDGTALAQTSPLHTGP
jgi:hypothetical protein